MGPKYVSERCPDFGGEILISGCPHYRGSTMVQLFELVQLVIMVAVHYIEIVYSAFFC